MNQVSHLNIQHRENKRYSQNLYYISIFIILLISLTVYCNALFNEFVYDDITQVGQNHWITDIRYIREIFSSNVWGFVGAGGRSSYYRPLMHLIYMVNYYIFGLNPWGYHLVNIFFHAGVSVLVFMIIARFIQGREHHPYFYPPLLATVLFATHPIHTHAVTWIAGLPDPSFTLFFLLSFYLYILSSTEGIVSKPAYFLSLLFFFLATLFKEPALTLPVILIAYDYAFNKLSFSGSPFIYAKRYLPYLIVVGLYFILRIYAIGGIAPLKRHVELSSFQYVINVFPLFIQYLEKLVLPLNLNALYVFHPISSIFEMKSVVSLILTAIFVWCTCVALRKNKVVFLSLIFIAVPLLPALYIPALGDSVFSERYLYLPSVGLAILIAEALVWIQAKKPKFVMASGVISFALICLFCAGTVKRNTVWKDNYSLWTDTVEKSPDAALPYSELGIYYLEKGLVDNAIDYFKIAIRLQPSNPDYYNNLGSAYAKKGRLDKASEQFKSALHHNPQHLGSLYNLGLAYSDSGMMEMAIHYYQTVLRLNPRHVKALNSLGIIYGRQGMAAKAIVYFQAALKLEPDDPRTHHNLANAYLMAGRVEKAREHRQKARSLQ